MLLGGKLQSCKSYRVKALFIPKSVKSSFMLCIELEIRKEKIKKSENK